jgi:hypothetical protein
MAAEGSKLLPVSLPAGLVAHVSARARAQGSWRDEKKPPALVRAFMRARIREFNNLQMRKRARQAAVVPPRACAHGRRAAKPP